MIIYDGIIEKLQTMGGISVLFKELVSRSDPNSFEYYSYDNSSHLSDKCKILDSRVTERYRDFNLKLQDFDVFHSTYYRLPVIRKNIVTTVHDFTYEKFVSGMPKIIHSWQKKRAVMNSDHVICVSENTARDLQYYYGIEDHKISIVYNGVSEDYKPLDNKKLMSSLLYVGARSEYKNFKTLVKALVQLRDFNLRIVGNNLSKDELKFLDENIPNRYQFLGRLTNKELNIEYNNAYAFIYPSSYEGFGIPVLEAMRAGCPVLAMNSSSLPEVVGDAGILIDKNSPEEIIEGLKQLDFMRTELIKRGFVQSSKFSWDKCYKDTLDVYEKF